MRILRVKGQGSRVMVRVRVKVRACTLSFCVSSAQDSSMALPSVTACVATPAPEGCAAPTPAPQLYTCMDDQCKPNASGVPLVACKAACSHARGRR